MLTALGSTDDEGQSRCHEQRVAQTPEDAHGDQVVDVAREGGDPGGEHDQHEPDGQGALRAVPVGGPPGDEHRDHLDAEVHGEQQRQFRRRRVQLLTNGVENRIDQTDTHEGDDGCECRHPHSTWLAFEGLGE